MNKGANNKIDASNLLLSLKQAERIIPKYHPFYSFLHFIVWEEKAYRIFLEILFIGLTYNLVYIYLEYNSYLPLPLSIHIGILSIIGASVLFFDAELLSKGNKIFKDAFLKSYSGNIESAIDLLKSSKKRNLPPSPYKYHLALSELNFINGKAHEGDISLENALRNGADPFQCIYTRMRSLLFSNDYKQAFEGISEFLTHSPFLEFEYAVSLMLEDSTRVDAMRNLKSLCDISQISEQKILHPSGADLHDISYIMLLCLELNSGKADEALDKLQMIFDHISPQLNYFPALRPYIALSYLERARYFIKKSKKKKQAKCDITRALAICSYPLHIEIADRIIQCE